MDESAVMVGDASWRNEGFSEAQQGKMHVFFHTEQVQSNFLTEKEGRPMFIEKIYLTKLIPGDNRLKIDRPIRDADKADFPVEWSRFQQKLTNTVAGTPLSAWSILTDTQRAEFRALNIFTIDQFASLPDSAGEKIMGFSDLREKARLFIAASKDSALLDRMRKESTDRIAAQDQKIAELTAMIEQLTAPKKDKVSA